MGVRGLAPQFWSVWAATLINRAGGFVVIYLAVFLTTQRHFSPSLTGLIVGLYGAGGAIGVLIGGQLTDRWGRRPSALLSLSVAPVCTVLLGLSHPPVAIAAATFAVGLAAESARPALAAIIADVVPDRDRMRAFNIYYWAINAGFSIAALVAGLAARSGYLTLFVADAATTAMAAVLIACTVRETKPSESFGGTPEKAPEGPNAFRDRLFLGVVAGNLFFTLVMAQSSSSLPITMARDGLSAGTYGRVMAVNGLMIVVCQMFVTRLVRGRSPSRVLAVSMTVVGVGYGLTALTHTTPLYILSVAIWTFGEMFAAPSNSALVAALSPAAARGRYQGVFSLSWQGASFAGPILGGLVQQHVGRSAVWLGCLGLGLIASLLHVLSTAARAKRAAELAAAETTIPEPVLSETVEPPVDPVPASDPSWAEPHTHDPIPTRAEPRGR